MKDLIIETPRLLIREITKEDTLGMYQLDSNPEVHRYLGNNTITSVIEAEKVIDYIQEQYKKYGLGRWAVIHKSTNNFLGWCGLKFNPTTLNDVTDYYDLGYRFRMEFWGNGFAFESAQACVTYGFEKLKLPAIYAAAHQGNIASNQILKKIGFQKIGDFLYINDPQFWYKIQ